MNPAATPPIPAPSGFVDPAQFAFVRDLEAASEVVRAELLALAPEAFAPAPDSLTTVEDGYDERGWHWFGLSGGSTPPEVLAQNRARCPATARVVDRIPGLRNAGFSRFGPGTHLYPHRGELPGVLRCHLALVVPPGDVGIRFGAETRGWLAGRCLVIDDTLEHEAWNHAASDRVVLLVTFDPGAGDAAASRR